jgi:hypothetical protein
MDENIEDQVGDILDQLKSAPKVIRKVESLNLTKENLEEFILKYAGDLVQTSSDAVNTINDHILSAPTAEDVVALAELIKASNSSIETLNKMFLTDKKHHTLIKIKQMDVDSRKKELDTAIGAKLLMSREELMKQFLMNVSEPIKTIDGEIIQGEIKQLTNSEDSD